MPQALVFGTTLRARVARCTPPPLAIPPPPWGGTVTWPKKHRKHQAPELIYTVILRYNFVVQSPPSPPLWGGTVTTLGGGIARGGGTLHVTFATMNRFLNN